jgi:hypothetical protein
MKKYTGYVFALALMLATSTTYAMPMTYNFSQTGFSGGATISGSFTGNDLDMDGAINSFLGEVTNYSVSFSGNMIVGAFSHSFADLGGLIYVLGNGVFLGDDAILGTEGVASGPGFGPPGGPFTYESGLGPQGTLGGIVIDNNTGATDGSQNLVVVTAVPEPAIITLMGLGLVGIGFSRRKAR